MGSGDGRKIHLIPPSSTLGRLLSCVNTRESFGRFWRRMLELGMVRCPKCSFVQPEDQFCANCGIDMLNYKPEAPPLVVRPFKLWSVQLLIILGIIFAIFSYFEVPQKTFEEGLEVIRKVARVKNEDPPKPESTNDIIDSAEKQVADIEMAGVQNPIDGLKAEAPPVSGNPDAQSVGFSVRFIKIRPEQYPLLLQKFRADDRGEYAIFPKPELSASFSDSIKKVLVSSISGGVAAPNEKLEFFHGPKDLDGKFHGLKFSVVNLGTNPQFSTIEIHWSRIWADQSEQMEHGFSETCARGGGILVRNLLPNLPIMTDELRKMYSEDPLLRYLPGVNDEKSASDGAKRNVEIIAIIDIR